MKRKFLEDLGLEKDVVDKVMRENGKDRQSERSLRGNTGNPCVCSSVRSLHPPPVAMPNMANIWTDYRQPRQNNAPRW